MREFLILYLKMRTITQIKMVRAENLLKDVPVHYYENYNLCDISGHSYGNSSETHLNDIIHDGLINYDDWWGIHQCYWMYWTHIYI